MALSKFHLECSTNASNTQLMYGSLISYQDCSRRHAACSCVHMLYLITVQFHCEIIQEHRFQRASSRCIPRLERLRFRIR